VHVHHIHAVVLCKQAIGGAFFVTEMAMGAPPIASPVLGVSLRITKLNGITVRYAEAGCPTNPMVLFW
jgi:hypothetical protein